MAQTKKKFILWFSEVGIHDVPLVGGKNASLGEMYRTLTKRGVRVPNGFAVTSAAYRAFLEASGAQKEVKRILKTLRTKDVRNLAVHGRQVRDLIKRTPLPAELEQAITNAYDQLAKHEGHPHLDVAVRSSATAEDLADASFAGQQETYLNIRGHEALLDAVRKAFASLFTDRAISYRADKGFNHFKVALSVGVQKMVRSDKASSGVMFSIDTESGFKDVVLINSIYGLGENIVQGAVSPDEFYVHKPTLKAGFPSIISKQLGTKRWRMVYSTGKTPTENLPVAPRDRVKFSITNDEILQLARWAVIIEDHYSKEAKRFKPMDMEWAKDGITGRLYIVQARPETVQSQRDTSILEEYQLTSKAKTLVTGVPVGAKIGTGTVRVLSSAARISAFKRGEVLVTKMTDPDWEPIMKIASAIVTDEGGRTCHAAIISRELGIPCLVGTGNATKRLKTGQVVTVSCAEGDSGRVYQGKLPFRVKRTNLKKLKKPKTMIQMIFGTPELAFQTAQIPNDGVGLAREEFIITSHIKIHPMALIKYPKLKDPEAIRKINSLTAGYEDKVEYYVDKLSQGIATIAAAFYPKEVIVRLSDFRTNEYADLIGGREFEPDERNPMIGWRGASRYYDPKYRRAFDLECRALRRVREHLGLKNVKVMVPFCRTVEEGKLVLKAMAANGLVRGKDGLEVFVMCEIPSNVILADKFADIFDGFSIGSNDLTQLTLGLDRDSGIVAHVGNERNEAVLRLISQVIKVARARHKKIGICGQGPSDFPDLARFLVKEGINALSLNPDTVLKTTVDIAKTEARLSGRSGKRKRRSRKSRR